MRSLLLVLAMSGLAAVKPAGPAVKLPDAPTLTNEGRALIHEYEVGGGEAYYARFLSRPTWPGHASGVTVGVGYDLGYNSRAVILEDWRAVPERARLASVAGVKGTAAKSRLSEVRDIWIQWDLAEDVFDAVTVTKFWSLCRRTFPGFDSLHPNCQAALLSLIFNRGSSMSGPSRSEMRSIREHVPKKNYAAIATELRKMKRIWAGTAVYKGLARRREAEARLVETCR